MAAGEDGGLTTRRITPVIIAAGDGAPYNRSQRWFPYATVRVLAARWVLEKAITGDQEKTAVDVQATAVLLLG